MLIRRQFVSNSPTLLELAPGKTHSSRLGLFSAIFSILAYQEGRRRAASSCLLVLLFLPKLHGEFGLSLCVVYIEGRLRLSWLICSVEVLGRDCYLLWTSAFSMDLIRYLHIQTRSRVRVGEVVRKEDNPVISTTSGVRQSLSPWYDFFRPLLLGDVESEIR